MSARVGRYEVLAQLTKGGMAELLLVSAESVGGFRKYLVAKRVLPETASEEAFVRMFLDEARITASLNHPNICQLFEFGQDPDGSYFAVMEFIAGQDLAHVVAACAKQQAVLPLGFSLAVVHECALALQYAHTFRLPSGEDLPVIHRDVAQKNIMVTYDGQVKLIDFGIAKARGALSKTRAGTVKGTAGYMSPEQVRGEALDGRSDVFSLGVVLWEMVTGRRLFSGESELEELKMILSMPIQPPIEVEPSVDAELSAIVMQALERDPARRFRSARELARAVAQQRATPLFDADERAAFMRERFQEQRLATQKLFEQRPDTEMAKAVEEFRRTSSHQVPIPPKVRVKVRAAGPSAARLGQVSGGRARAAKVVRDTTETSSASSQRIATNELIPTPPLPEQRPWGLISVVGGVLLIGLVIAVRAAVYEEPPPPARVDGPLEGAPVEAARASELPGVELPGAELPGVEPATTEAPSPADPGPSRAEGERGASEGPRAEAPVKRPRPESSRNVPKELGEVVLALIPEATVSKGKQELAKGSMVTFSLPVGTHLVTVTGADRVRRTLSLQVVAGKNKPMRFRLEDLPAQ